MSSLNHRSKDYKAMKFTDRSTRMQSLRKDRRNKAMQKKRAARYQMNLQVQNHGLTEAIDSAINALSSENPGPAVDHLNKIARASDASIRESLFLRIVARETLPRLLDISTLAYTQNMIDMWEKILTIVCNMSSCSTHMTLETMIFTPQLVNILKTTNNADAIELCAWVIYNQACDPIGKVKCGEMDIVRALYSALSRVTSAEIVFHIVWALKKVQNRGPESAEFEMLIPHIMTLVQSGDIEFTFAGLRMVAHAAIRESNLPLIVSRNIYNMITTFAAHPDPAIRESVLVIITNVASSVDPRYTQLIFSHNLFPMICEVIQRRDHMSETMVAEALKALSNVTASCNVDHVKYVITHPIFNIIRNMAITESNERISSEAVWTVVNIVSANLPREILLQAIDQGLVREATIGLRKDDAHLNRMCTMALETMYEGSEKVSDQMDACGTIEALEKLLNHPNDSVSNPAGRLIDTIRTDESLGEFVQPAINADGSFFINTSNVTPNNFSF